MQAVLERVGSVTDSRPQGVADWRRRRAQGLRPLKRRLPQLDVGKAPAPVEVPVIIRWGSCLRAAFVASPAPVPVRGPRVDPRVPEVQVISIEDQEAEQAEQAEQAVNAEIVKKLLEQHEKKKEAEAEAAPEEEKEEPAAMVPVVTPASLKLRLRRAVEPLPVRGSFRGSPSHDHLMATAGWCSHNKRGSMFGGWRYAGEGGSAALDQGAVRSAHSRTWPMA